MLHSSEYSMGREGGGMELPFRLTFSPSSLPRRSLHDLDVESGIGGGCEVRHLYNIYSLDPRIGWVGCEVRHLYNIYSLDPKIG